MGFIRNVYLFIRAVLTFLIALPLALKNVKVSIALAIAVIIIVGVEIYRFLFPLLPKSVQVFDVIWLDQGWTEDQREKYYQTSQGTLILPYSSFFALEQPPLEFWPLRIHHH